MTLAKVSSRLVYMTKLVEMLQACGGVLWSHEVYEAMIAGGIALRSDLDAVLKYGETRFAKEVRFARNELADAGLLHTRADGLWSLSDEGWKASLTIDDARTMVSDRRRGVVKRVYLDSDASEVSGRPTRGPAPTDWERVVSHHLAGQSWTYAFRFGTSNVWKIGFAGDVSDRLAVVNQHVPHELLGQKWSCHSIHPWADAIGAYTMEQRLLRELATARTVGERVHCSEETLLNIWASVSSALFHSRLRSPLTHPPSSAP